MARKRINRKKKPTKKTLATNQPSRNDKFERIANELADYFEQSLPPNAKSLSDYAMSREGIYEDR